MGKMQGNGRDNGARKGRKGRAGEIILSVSLPQSFGVLGRRGYFDINVHAQGTASLVYFSLVPRRRRE